jgi:hypothetical protein
VLRQIVRTRLERLAKARDVRQVGNFALVCNPAVLMLHQGPVLCLA